MIIMFTRIKKMREEKELTQKEIAKILNVTQQTYSIWEKGNKIVPLKHLNTIANYYDISMDYLTGISDEKNKSLKIKALDKKNIGKNLQNFRKKYQITQNVLANQLNTTHSVISAYENGKTLILTAFLYQICKKWNVSMDDMCSNNINFEKK